MDLRRAIASIVLIASVVALSAPALAGGYAVVRLDEPPGDVLVATPWRFGFMVLQHDVTPNSDVTPVVRALHKETGEEITATGRQEGAVGHFVAEVTFPRAGEWKWSIEPLPYAETSFETLTVLESPHARVDETSRATPPAPDETLTVEILDTWVFQPYSLEVATGDTVTWVNHSDAAHTVTGDHLAFDDSGLIEPGDSFRQTFDEPGTYRYKCGPHPGMTGVIVVA
jgi:plastocyanin